MLDKNYQGEEFKAYMSGYREGCKDTTMRLCTDEDGWCQYVSVEKPMTLDEFKKQEDLWESLGEPMTQEELDELHHVEIEEDYGDEFFENDGDIWYDKGYTDGLIKGREQGYDNGFECGYEEAKAYNVILDGEILDEIYDFKEQILGFRKEPWSENHEHNKMVFELHHSLVALTETWVMNQVWDYWYRRKEELENE